MPTLPDSGPNAVNQFIDWLYGNENNPNAAIAAVAKHVQAQVTHRPAAGGPARWPDITTMRYMVQNIGPSATAEQFEEAFAEFVAS